MPVPLLNGTGQARAELFPEKPAAHQMLSFPEPINQSNSMLCMNNRLDMIHIRSFTHVLPISADGIEVLQYSFVFF